MKRSLRRTLPPLLALCGALSLAACGDAEGNGKGAAEDIVNGDFEDVSANAWVGWTRKDAAFNFRGVTDAEETGGVPVEKSGKYFFSGKQGGNPAMRGTLTSDLFKLGGNGFVTFKMGAGKNTEKVYVEFFEEGNDAAIARVTNPECDGVFITDHLITKVVDLSGYLGKNIYIKVTDDDDGNDFSYVNLDAFRVCASEEEVASAREEYKRQIETYGEKPFEEDETSATIVNGGFETGDLTGWKTLEGTALVRAGVVSTGQYYWEDRSVYGEGEYYLDGSNNGAIAENLTGAIRSTKFTLGGDGYISFMIGAGNGNCYVALCDGGTDEELLVLKNEYFSDPSLALTLLRVYMDASPYVGKVVYLKVVDANDGGGFAFLNVDDFQVSLTADEVAELEVRQMEKIQAETYNSATYDDLAALRNYYSSCPYPVPLNSLTFNAYVADKVVDCGTVDVSAYLAEAEASYGAEKVSDIAVSGITFGDTEITQGFDAVDMSTPGYYHVTYTASREGASESAEFTVVAMDGRNSVANGGFEAGNLAGWTVLTEGWSMVGGRAAGVISAESYWNEALPYNQAGEYHLDGWNNGLDEGATWAVRSTDFTLAGSGYISVRMGGHAAAVHVYLADGTEVGYYKQNRFNDANFPSVGAGGSWADMGTYVMDLKDYIGQELYIVLADEQADGWAHAFFDEVVTYYETAPDYENNADEVPDGATGDPVRIPWQLAENSL